VAGCVWWGMVDMADKDSQLPQLETSTIARPTLVTLTIAAKTSSAVAELDAELRKAAAEHGARIANIHGYFLGHGLRAGNPAQLIPDRRIGDLWFCNIIEPMPGAPARCIPHYGTPSTPTDVLPSCG
jgi:hypothetical protein